MDVSLGITLAAVVIGVASGLFVRCLRHTHPGGPQFLKVGTPLSDAEVERIREEWRSAYAGSGYSYTFELPPMRFVPRACYRIHWLRVPHLRRH